MQDCTCMHAHKAHACLPISSACIVKSSFSSLFFFFKVLSTSEVQQISNPLGCDGFSVPRFTSNLKCLRACLSLVFTQGCFFLSPGDPRQTVTLKTNKTASAMLIFFEGSRRNGTNILSWQTAASEVMDRPARDTIIYQWSRMSALLYLSALSLWIVCSLSVWKEALYGGERQEKIFLPGHQQINGDVLTCLWAQWSLHIMDI